MLWNYYLDKLILLAEALDFEFNCMFIHFVFSFGYQFQSLVCRCIECHEHFLQIRCQLELLSKLSKWNHLIQALWAYLRTCCAQTASRQIWPSHTLVLWSHLLDVTISPLALSWLRLIPNFLQWVSAGKPNFLQSLLPKSSWSAKKIYFLRISEQDHSPWHVAHQWSSRAAHSFGAIKEYISGLEELLTSLCR